ncbi:ABC transporter permease [Caldilinea sp.]|jgi:ABC-type dipeptide/oligopeptide/nickel transport system permease component|uniref:ABC transporter permease n=1 Tax=Caldilinea sp. TaxID=2293560 RepID=UPI0021DD217E|nr:ABC transporter permease [Caldilinea sp.]GIV67183.1 MAG: peptide ABC transporter permease [Caldilinea sp.]
MTQYILRRFLWAIPVLLGASFLVFWSIRWVPGDPAIAIAGELATPELVEKVRAELGLDQPLPIQYGIYLGRMLRGDMGTSVRSGLPVFEEIRIRLPRTLQLTFFSLLFAAAIGIPIGVLSATRANTWIDALSMIFALLGVSMPIFWLGLMLIVFFALTLPSWLGLNQPILPPTGAGTWQHLVMPTIALAANSMAIQARMTRASMLEVLRSDYIRTARAKGVPEFSVVYNHGLRNALIPIVTVIGLQFGTLLGGAVLTETVFAWPGIGRLLVDSIGYRDYPVIQGTVLVITVGFVLVNILVDVLYAYLDPRIRYT